MVPLCKTHPNLHLVVGRRPAGHGSAAGAARRARAAARCICSATAMAPAG
jgi:hypothetical protein